MVSSAARAVRPIIPPYRVSAARARAEAAATAGAAAVTTSTAVNTELNAQTDGAANLAKAALVLNRRARAVAYPPKFYRRHVRPLKGRAVPDDTVSWATHNVVQLFDGALEPESIDHCGANATLGLVVAARPAGGRRGKGTRRRPRRQTPRFSRASPSPRRQRRPPQRQRASTSTHRRSGRSGRRTHRR